MFVAAMPTVSADLQNRKNNCAIMLVLVYHTMKQPDGSVPVFQK